jgi:hypothetical protein
MHKWNNIPHTKVHYCTLNRNTPLLHTAFGKKFTYLLHLTFCEKKLIICGLLQKKSCYCQIPHHLLNTYVGVNKSFFLQKCRLFHFCIERLIFININGFGLASSSFGLDVAGLVNITSANAWVSFEIANFYSCATVEFKSVCDYLQSLISL